MSDSEPGGGKEGQKSPAICIRLHFARHKTDMVVLSGEPRVSVQEGRKVTYDELILASVHIWRSRTCLSPCLFTGAHKCITRRNADGGVVTSTVPSTPGKLYSRSSALALPFPLPLTSTCVATQVSSPL